MYCDLYHHRLFLRQLHNAKLLFQQIHQERCTFLNCWPVRPNDCSSTLSRLVHTLLRWVVCLRLHPMDRCFASIGCSPSTHRTQGGTRTWCRGGRDSGPLWGCCTGSLSNMAVCLKRRTQPAFRCSLYAYLPILYPLLNARSFMKKKKKKNFASTKGQTLMLISLMN